MDANNDFVEFSGDTVEAAISAGLEHLGVSPDDVLVEVLEEPSRGVFGIGAKQAKVRLKLLRRPKPAPSPDPEPVNSVGAAQSDYAVDETDESDEEVLEVADAVADDELDDDARVGREVLAELLEKMRIVGEIVVRRSDPSRPGESAPWLLDVTGPDMSLLIGRRGETLNALQYITRLIASRRLQRRSNIIIDAGGYKSQRSQRLRQLALRMAEQAIQQSRTVYLEPMPPNERRIVHLALRDHPDVETHSTGDGDSRKVTIVPKQS